ncbi:maltotransferase domain-containing protein, partial [Streptomyces sp. NPDC048664]|uniref:alpha-1,4-glucan--maltose-1-phosphate maltosyltransferase n=1 Tax=Streptomyces sp. NPDC048664 TaxID=3154505 RepID=UPI0034345B57
IKIPAGIDTELVLLEGAELLERAVVGVPEGSGREVVVGAVAGLRDVSCAPSARLAAGLADGVSGVLGRFPLREGVSSSGVFSLLVERERALFGSWYEFFPRSEGTAGVPHGSFRSAARRLPVIASMGFDVVYLPPVHPIGSTFRKGRNNGLSAGVGDVGVPWAIGSAAGGHEAVHPELGSVEDFVWFVERARGVGLEVALDFALQCSPDHPWVGEHPEWFRWRGDGSVAFAENPPKKYQDIYPVFFDGDMDGLVAESVRLLRLWMGRGVRIFRVDNPHTKPVVFWERVLGEIGRSDPDVIFLAEAFTRPAMVRVLAEVGFQQSYTYFTWRNTKGELTEYLTELSGGTSAVLRPNLFVNTPDILHAYLQEGGRGAFEVRAVLAATLSPSWGMYSGFELCENQAAGPGSEEYADSEKYQLRPRDWERAEREGRTIVPLITRLNMIRRSHPALRRLRNLRFHEADNDQVIVYSKCSGADVVVVVVNLDPWRVQEATVSLDLAALGFDGDASLEVCDELTGAVYAWGRSNYVRLEPGRSPAHVLSVRRRSVGSWAGSSEGVAT